MKRQQRRHQATQHLSQNSFKTNTDIIAWTEVNHHYSPLLLLYKMAENLVIDVHFKAYHFEKTAEKGGDYRSEHKCREIHRQASFKGTAANAWYLYTVDKNIWSVLTTFRCCRKVYLNTVPRQLV
jgi:hypothetical protein